MISSAVISICGQYRYVLFRIWDKSKNLLTFVMLNPSTADHNKDDPTISQCIKIATALGFGGIQVVNLFAFRATDPKVMMATADPIGPENETYLKNIMYDARRGQTKIVCAFGAKKFVRSQARHLFDIADKYDIDLYCLRELNDNMPQHPLFVPAPYHLRNYQGF